MTTSVEPPVLVFAPHGRDAELMAKMLATHGITVRVCNQGSAILDGMQTDAGCVIITQEAIDTPFLEQLSASLEAQPPWSDFPFVLLMSTSTTQTLDTLTKRLGNVTILERPVAPQTLLAATRAALRARTRQFDARSAIQQRDQFLAMLGHELRNPLAGIVLAARLIRTTNDRSQLIERIEVIERQSNVLARLVDDLLDVARVTTGKVRLRREAVDIDSAIHSCLVAHEDRARQRSINVVLVHRSGAIIEGDAVRIEQVVSNLLSNAIKYSPAGRTVRVSSALDNDVCEIRVRDDGIGITADMQPHVFDLFAQADSTIDRAEGGMGIGLTLVDRLVRLHGGSITLVSAGLGQGSEFIVRLPVGSPPTQENVIPLEPRIAAERIRVVLVEDNADLRMLTAEMLEALGCTVAVAVDGPDGVDLIARTRPEVALVDIGLPRLDGFGVARELRKRLGSGQLLVAVTGYGRDQDREEAQRAGFDLHLTKPLAVDALQRLITLARGRRAAS